MVTPISPGNINNLLNSIERNKTGLSRSLEKIASGRRLNRAGEDPAANAIATQLRSDIAALTQATRNVDSGANFIRTAEGGLSTISDLLSRGRELAVQAANGTLGDAQRQALNAEFTQIKAEIDRISQSSEFNGQKLLNGDLGSESETQIDIQAGIGSGPENRINLNVIEDTGTEALGIANADISTSAGALQAFSDLDQAQATVIATQGEVGAVANRLVTTANGLGTSIENLTAAESGLADTDLAEEVSNLQIRLNLLQSSISALANQLQQSERSTGRLLDFSI